MRAVLCHAFGPIDQIRYEETPDPPIAPGMVRVAVKAAGVNFPDVLICQGKYQFTPPLPFSPGGEVAGEILELGEGVEGFSVGDRVIAIAPWGGYAEQLVTGANTLTPLPEGMDFTTGAALTLTYATVIHALVDRARLKAGETVLVLGAAGGVGSATIEVAKAMGARVIAAASSDEKLAFCKTLGADEVINYRTEDLKKRAKALSDGGVDVVMDPVGGDYAEPALRAIGWKGRFLVVGFAGGSIPRIPLNLALLKGCDIVGVFWGRFTALEPEAHQAHMETLARWCREGAIQPRISRVLPLSQAVEALQALEGRTAVGKLVLVP